MKIIISTAIILFSTVFFITCQNRTPKVKSADSQQLQKKSPGRIEFSQEIHNFGSVKAGEIVSFAFKFKNIGGSSLQLTKVEPTCGCITVNYNKEEVSSSAYSYIEVTFNSAGEWGNILKTIDLETSAGEKKMLTIGAFVENSIINIDLNSSK